MHSNKTVLLIDNTKDNVKLMGSPFDFVYTAGDSIRNVSKMKFEAVIMESTDDAPGIIVSFPHIGVDVPCVRHRNKPGGVPDLFPARSYEYDIDFPLPEAGGFNRLAVRITDARGEPVTGVMNTRVVIFLSVYHTVREEEPYFDLQLQKQDTVSFWVSENGFKFDEPLKHVRNLTLKALVISPQTSTLIQLRSDMLGIDWTVAIDSDGRGVVANQYEVVWDSYIALSRADFALIDASSGTPLLGTRLDAIFQATYLNA